MAKHLAKTEKKKRPEKPVREIRIPEINLRKRASAPPETERKDPFQSAMLNKTLDRRFTPSDLFLTLLAHSPRCFTRGDHVFIFSEDIYASTSKYAFSKLAFITLKP